MDIIAPPSRDPLGRFPPGRSGNPSGRPALAPEVRAAVQEIFAAASAEAAERLVNLMRDEDPRVSAAAAVHILDRLLGKVAPPAEAKEKAEDIGAAHLRILQELQERRAVRLGAATVEVETARDE
jgi:hypothetical protein